MAEGNMVYIPISEETLALIAQLKMNKEEDWDSVLKKILQNQIYQKDVDAMQSEKMKELWDNPYDDIWNNV